VEPNPFFLSAELLGVAVFAASGASAAVAKRLDMFGVVVIAAITALGGGLTRDVLIGATPPLALSDWRYPAVGVAAGIIVFYVHPALSKLRTTMLVLDAAGLALFTVTGTLKGLDFGLAVYAACIVGVLSGVGGGILRDILTQQIPVVLRADFYALPAAVGSVAVAVGFHWESVIGTTALLSGAGALIFAVRLLAIRFRWVAPKPNV
jgi:uncharacterized membrane protein YeiH